MSREAMKQALEALEAAKNNHGVMLLSDPPQEAWRFHRVSERCSIAITALRQAIEQAEQQEPVAWLKTWSDGSLTVLKTKSHAFADRELEPLYSAPPKQEWVGLTGDEVNEFAAGCHLGNSVQGAIRKAEAKLKEKNT